MTEFSEHLIAAEALDEVFYLFYNILRGDAKSPHFNTGKRMPNISNTVIVYGIATLYTLVWIVIWIRVLRYRNKDFDKLYDELIKLDEEHNTLKEDYSKLEGRYEELLRITSRETPDNKPTLADQGHLPN